MNDFCAALVNLFDICTTMEFRSSVVIAFVVVRIVSNASSMIYILSTSMLFKKVSVLLSSESLGPALKPICVFSVCFCWQGNVR